LCSFILIIIILLGRILGVQIWDCVCSGMLGIFVWGSSVSFFSFSLIISFYFSFFGFMVNLRSMKLLLVMV
jgi:hypothetical protein